MTKYWEVGRCQKSFLLFWSRSCIWKKNFCCLAKSTAQHSLRYQQISTSSMKQMNLLQHFLSDIYESHFIKYFLQRPMEWSEMPDGWDSLHWSFVKSNKKLSCFQPGLSKDTIPHQVCHPPPSDTTPKAGKLSAFRIWRGKGEHQVTPLHMINSWKSVKNLFQFSWCWWFNQKSCVCFCIRCQINFFWMILSHYEVKEGTNNFWYM